jgi:hypothetical protein
MNKFKLFIMAAGIGSRNTHYPGLHKALLPIENVPAISRILQNVAVDVEVVVAVGYLKEQLISYLKYMHPERKFTFVDQNPYQGVGVGPAHAVLAAKDELNCPFIITTCDTVIPSKVQHTCPTEDWIGVDKIGAVTYACIEDGALVRKSISPIYIGVAGVADWQKYILRLEQTGSKENTDGFSSFDLVPFNWIDTGSDSTYELLNHSIVVPEKEDQAVFLHNDRVVKFWTNPDVAERVYQVAKRLGHDVTKVNEHMVGYPLVEGTLFTDFFTMCQEQLEESLT